MSYPSWPASLPQTPRRDGWVGGAQETRAQFQPEFGPPISRGRSTAQTEIYNAVFPNLSTAQRATFVAFFRDDLAQGSLAFAMTDPVTQEVARWRILGGDGGQAYSFTAKRAGWHDLSLQMMRLPGSTWFTPYLPAGTLLVPDMVLDFANQVYGVGGVRKSFADIITFSRVGTADYYDVAGVLQTAAIDEPRFDHDPSTHVPLGLLMDDTDADVAAINPTEWPTGLWATEGTMQVICRSEQATAPTYRRVFAARNAATTDILSLFLTSANCQFRATTASVIQASNDHGSYTLGSRLVFSAAFAANDFRSSRTGGAVIADISGTMPVVDRARLGEGEDEVRIEKVVIWNTALDSATLQSLSA